MDHVAGRRDDRGGLGVESGLDAFQASPEFRGPVEPLDDHVCNGHLAHVYQTAEEKFEAAVPFVRDGLEHGDRVMYIVDVDRDKSVVRTALRDGGVDVDAAVDAGALTFHAAEDTYLRGGTFDADELLEFYAGTVAAATEEYDALRVVAEATGLHENGASAEQCMKYESKINELFSEADCLAICQYDRRALPPEIVRDVVRTHPHLVYDGTVCHNHYYTPPEEFVGPDDPAREVDRMLGTLRDRTDAKAELQRRERYLRRSYEITSDPDCSFEEKLQALFDLGTERFDLELGAMARVDVEADRFELEHVSADHEHFEPGLELPLSETYCAVAAEVEAAGSVSDPRSEGFEDVHVYRKFGIEAYLGTYVEVEGSADRTFFFVTESSRAERFSDQERAFLQLMGQWVKYELERRQREAQLRRRKTHFETVFEQSDDGIFVVDLETEAIVDANPAACELTGYARDDLTSLRASDVYAHEPERFRAFLDEVRDDGSAWSESLDCRTAGGRDVPTEVSASTITLDGRPLVLANVRDVGTRKTHERFQRELHETIADPDASFEDKVTQLLELGRERFDLEVGYFTDVDEDGILEIVDVVGSHDVIEEGISAPVSETYCKRVLASDEPLAASDATAVGLADHPACQKLGLESVFATTVHVGGDAYGTLCFASQTPRQRPFTEAEQTFLELMSQCLRYELEGRRRERYLRESYDITSDPDLGFEDKLERLLELGRDQFGLEMGGLNHLPDWDGEFRVEKGVGLGLDPDEELWTDPGSDCYCRHTVDADGPVGKTDVRGTDWADDEVYQNFGIASYLGTKVSTGTAPYGTLWFGSTKPREQPFSEVERSFVELMGQWVSYEVERREHHESQRELYEITANTDLDTEEKIERLLAAGSERLNLPVGLLTRAREQSFEVVHTNGSHPDLEEGFHSPPLTENYCRRVVETGDSISVGDAAAAGWDSDALYQEYGLETYAGTQVTVRGEVFGTVFFTDTSPREPFTEAERSFLDLLGQCVSYELEHQRREADLEETIDQLEQSNDRLKQFAYAASHDLQEPLRMVSSYLQLLENRYADALDEDAEEYIEFAVDGADRMRAMVDDLLAFSRVEQSDGSFEPVDCDAVVDRVTNDLQIQIEEQGAEIAAASLPTVLGDSEQLEQLFGNLVSNAIKYNETEPPRVEITADRRADEWKLSVSDNGIGIDPDSIDRVFEVFKRLHHDDEYSGTGIGLSLCQEIVENHGGEIWVESEPGEGSTFSFTLPVARGVDR